MRIATKFCHDAEFSRIGYGSFAYLALKQNKPLIALSIIEAFDTTNYNLIKNLLVVVYCQLNRLHESMEVLKSMMNSRYDNILQESVSNFLYN